jgi:hypothetical protein
MIALLLTLKSIEVISNLMKLFLIFQYKRDESFEKHFSTIGSNAYEMKKTTGMRSDVEVVAINDRNSEQKPEDVSKSV